MDSHDIDNILDFFRKRRFPCTIDIPKRISDDVIFVSIPSTCIAEKVERKKTSHRQLKYIQKAIKKELVLNVEFLIYRGEEHENIENNLVDLLNKRFPEQVKNCFLSFPESDAIEVWLDVDQSVLDEDNQGKKNIEEIIQQYFSLFDLTLKRIYWNIDKKELPALMQILRILKIHSPVTDSGLIDLISEQGHATPSSKWINQKLDILRKQKLILRQENGLYALTYYGLSIVPHSKNKHSSDIYRALAFKNKKW